MERRLLTLNLRLYGTVRQLGLDTVDSLHIRNFRDLCIRFESVGHIAQLRVGGLNLRGWLLPVETEEKIGGGLLECFAF